MQSRSPGISKPGNFVLLGSYPLFEMKHTGASKKFVITGWGTIDDNKTYDAISKRVRVPSTIELPTQLFDAPSDNDGRLIKL